MRLIPMLLAVAVLAPQAAQAQNCTPIRFEPGSSGALIDDVVPAEGQRCFSLSVRPGQQAHVGIVGGNDGIAVSVPGVADNRRSVDFVTKTGNYEILVHQTFRSVTPDPFSMQVRVR